MKKPIQAVILGATGLVGGELARRLLLKSSMTIHDWGRRSLLGDPLFKSFFRPEQHGPRWIEHHGNTEWIKESIDFANVDVVFCCLGTTIKKAKSKEVFRQIEMDFVLGIAKKARMQGVQSWIVISSRGADSGSSNFYLQTKGQVEAGLIALNFPRLTVLRPSLLVGPRKEFRFAEKLAERIFNPFAGLMPLGLRPVPTAKVAQAMFETGTKVLTESDLLAGDSPTVQIIENAKIHHFS